MKYDYPYQAIDTLPHSLREFIGYVFRRNPGLWVLFFVQDIIHFSRTYVMFFVLGLIIDRLTVVPQGSAVPSEIWIMAASVTAYFLTAEYMHVWTGYQISYWIPSIRAAIRTDFLRHVYGHSASYMQNHFAGSLSRKIVELGNAVGRLHDVIRFQIGFGIEVIGFASLVLFSISPLYGMVTLSFALAIALPLFFRMRRISGLSRDLANEQSHVMGLIVDSLSNSAMVRSFAGVGHEMTRHQAASRTEGRSHVRLRNRIVLVEILRRLTITGFSCGMLAFCLYGWQQEWITLGQIATIMGSSLGLLGSAWVFSGGVVQFFNESGAITDALATLNTPHEVVEREKAPPLSVSAGRIAFEDIRFSYGEAAPVFDGLSLTIASGQKVGLVGPSGAGKSTLISLLLRFHDTEGGRICIDGQNIAHVTQDSVRRAVALIPQDTALFHRSLLENIRYGRLDATDDEVFAAAEKAHIHDFIAGLPQGYHTEVGERGVRLSGGQRQRIAIARAILKDAPILILDEATSALDSESERLIQDSLAQLMAHKTVIAIAHRLSTIAHLDRLVVLENGHIVEDGSHDALARRGGLYTRLWSMQSGGFLPQD